MNTLNCDQCGKTYTTKPYLARKPGNHFCGSACYGEWQRVHRVGVGAVRVETACGHCGKTLSVPPSKLKPRNYCDRRCLADWRSDNASGANGPGWRGGTVGDRGYRGPNWPKQARAALRRDGHKCRHCGEADRLQVHHVRPYRLFADYRDANQLDNLLTLCLSCHGKAEMAFWKENPHLTGPPLCLPPAVACRRCGSDFPPRSGASRVCDGCCTTACARCGTSFISRRAVHRPVKFCTRECRNAAVATSRGKCRDCGNRCHKNADRCRGCDTAWYQKNPDAPRRGRRVHISPRLTSS